MAEKLNAVNFTSGKSVEESNKGLGGAMVGQSSDKGSVNDGVKALGQGSKVLVGESCKKTVIGGNEAGNIRTNDECGGSRTRVVEKAPPEENDGFSIVHLDPEEPDEQHNPTALNLNFRSAELIPSIANLNEIFGRYGPLMESETEITIKGRRNRAKVVFKRGEDAHRACGGAVDTFGVSLVSFWLKYVFKPRKKAKRNKKDTALSINDA